jgi:cyclase
MTAPTTSVPVGGLRPTMERTLIVARMSPERAAEVATIFAESDRSELPTLVGVRHRQLFRYGEDLYFHLIEAGPGTASAIADVRRHPLYVDINDRLSEHIRPYDAATWRSPADAMATSFYSWDALEGPAS